MGSEASGWQSVFGEFTPEDVDGDVFGEAAREQSTRDKEQQFQWVTDTHEMSRHVHGIVEGMCRYDEVFGIWFSYTVWREADD